MTQRTKTSTDNGDPSTTGEQSIEQLQARYQALNTRKIQAETHLQNAREQLAALKKQALEAYGTDDVEQLREQLLKMKSENEQKRQNYQAELNRIEGELSAVEQKFAVAENPSNASREQT